MRVLITGATGFLGGWTAKLLAKRGYSIIAAGRNLKKVRELAEGGCEFLALDLLDREAVLRKVQRDRIDAVVHCAAAVSPYGTLEYFLANNVIATKNIVDACTLNGIKGFVNISTPSVYFDYQHRTNIRESDPLPKRPASLYAATKLQAEEYALGAVNRGLRIVTLRPRGIFGPGDDVFLGSILRRVKHDRAPLINDGHSLIDLTYVENCVDAIALALNNTEKLCGEVFNITNGEPNRVKDICQWFYQAMGWNIRFYNIPYPLAYAQATVTEFVFKNLLKGKNPPITKYAVGLASKSQTLNIDKATELLGYGPKITLRDGLRISADAFKSLRKT